MQWTVEAVEDLKRLAFEGRSASAIAAAVGAASRNAVIGKANRIGIKLNGGGQAKPGKTPARAHRSPWAGSPRALSDGGEPRQLRVVPEAGFGFGEVEVGEMRRVTFEDMREFACRWPLGDPRAGDFAYCGLMTLRGHSYCAGHCRMAYRPPEARARRPPVESGARALAGSWRLA